MTDISIYFSPVDFDNELIKKGTLGESIFKYTEGDFPELDSSGVAIIYIPEYRDPETNKQQYSDSFRKELYDLYLGLNWTVNIYDLGTIQPAKDVKDTVFALSKVLEELIKNQIVPVVIGGSQDLTVSVYNAYKDLEQLVNLTSIDAEFDIGDIEKTVHNKGWLSHILLDKSCFLFNFSNLGAQSHYIPKGELELFDKLYFDVNRLGRLSEDLKLVEPVLRNSDIVSFDLSSIRFSDFQGEAYKNPNGFFANEACQIARYSGISDKLTVFGLFNYYPRQIVPSSTALLAQLIWYFIDGYANRKGDFPIGSKKTYKKYRVTFEDFKEEIVFYKSDRSARWWMEVPYPDSQGRKYERHHLVPCSYDEYKAAMTGDIPDLWWKTYQKLA